MRISNKILVMGTAGFFGGLIGSLFILPLLLRANFLNMSVMIGKFVTQESTPHLSLDRASRNSAKGLSKKGAGQATPTPIERPSIAYSPQVNYFSQAIEKIQPSVVAVQSFSGGVLMRYGSGIILTQDGLIATLNSIVPANASVIQVTNAGKIYKAKAVFRDYNKNIALISITAENNLPVARLNSDLPGLGQKLLVFAETVSFSEDKPLVEEALVSQADEKTGQFKLSLAYEQSFYGAAIADNDGNALGLLDYRYQKPVVILSKILNDILNAYLTPPLKKTI